MFILVFWQLRQISSLLFSFQIDLLHIDVINTHISLLLVLLLLKLLRSLSKIIEFILLGVVFVVTHIGNRVVHVAILRLDHGDQ